MEFGQGYSMETFHVRALKPVLLELIWIKPIGHHIFPLGFVAIFHELQLPAFQEAVWSWAGGP